MSPAVEQLTEGRSGLSDIRELTLDELARLATQAGEPSFRAGQLAQWLHRRAAESFDVMLNLSKGFRQFLKQHFTIGSSSTALVARARDGTRKLLIRLCDGRAIETVIIPAANRATLCLSSQVGCAMGCEFCATARMGLGRNLCSGEILDQIALARRELTEGEQLTNYVFMGMGEPLANYSRLLQALTVMTAPWGMEISPRKITVSTVGLAPMMERLLGEIPVRLAVSLHATTNEVRDRLVPINRRYPLESLLAACRRAPLKQRERITFEYVMLRAVNDSPEDAKRLTKLLGPLRAKVNLIFFNPFEGARFQAASRVAVEDFQAILQRGNLTATIRESRGVDVEAACGQLYVRAAAIGGPVSPTVLQGKSEARNFT